VSRAAAEVGSTANSYQILAKLAAGGMAEIFLARGEGVAGVERYCVLKRILRDRASDVHFVRMFLDEARLAAQLQHPNIAQVYDIGKLGDSYFFTMEYVHGETVRALLHRAQGLRRQLPINCVLTIAAGAAAGLHHAHARIGLDGRALDIVHRDVSPSNLMVSYEGGVKLVDFGVAKAADRSQETKSGTVKGKISYLSPEQCRGKRVDRRSDLFSLGICVWEMLTTERLFRRSSDFENMNAIVSEPTPPPSSRRPELPPELDALVLRLLAKSPDDRFQTADEVVEAIEAVAARTSSVLSASGLARFVRELFGQRPEPWLELESQHGPGEAITVTSEPIPRELGIALEDEVDHQLSSVVDLSSPRSVTASLDELQPEPVPFDVPTAQLGKPSKRGFPLAAPPPTNPGIALRPTGAPPESGASTAEALPPAPPGPASAPMSAPLAAASASGSMSMVAAVAASASASFAPASVAHATPSGAMPVIAVPAATARRTAGPRWPLYAVIGGAALVGSIAMVFMMRSGSGPAGEDAAGAALVAAAPVNRPRSPITVEPIEPAPTPPPVAPGSGEAPSGGATDPPAVRAPVKPAGTRAPPRTAGSGAPRPPAKREPVPDEMPRLYADGHYDKVVAQCDGPVSAEHAPLCFLAACHVGSEAAARRLITAVPAARRDQLTTNCKQLGVDIKKPDCEADPMACQH